MLNSGLYIINTLMNNKFIPYDYVNVRPNNHISFTWDSEVRTSLFVPLKNGSTSIQRWFRNDLGLNPDILGWRTYDVREETQDLDEHPWFGSKDDNIERYFVIRNPHERFKSAMTTVAEEFSENIALDGFYRTWYDHVSPVLTPLVKAITYRGIDPASVFFIRMENLNIFCPYHDNKTNWQIVNEKESETAPYVRILTNMNKYMLRQEERSYAWLCNNCTVADATRFRILTDTLKQNINSGEPPY